MLQSPSLQPARPRRWLWVGVIVAAIILAPVAWYLGSPLFINRTVNEEFPMSAGATVPQGMTRQQVEEEMRKASKVDSMMAESMPAAQTAPTVLVSGSFQSADAVHKGEGTATVYQIGTERVLRFDPFRSTNGPALYVYLSPHAAPRSSQQLHQGGSLELARLKGNIGAQNYTLPADVDLTKFKSVVIYCRQFHVVFSTAALAAK